MEQFDGDALVRAAARRVQMLDYYIGVEAETPVFSSCPTGPCPDRPKGTGKAVFRDAGFSYETQGNHRDNDV